MTSMREKIARAIDSVAWSGITPEDDYPVERARRETRRAQSLMEADAVLDALLEPTEGMLDAVCDAGPDTPHGAFTWNDAAGVITAMITAAKEGK